MWSGSSYNIHTGQIPETLTPILTLCWFSKVCPGSNLFNIEQLCLSSSPKQFLFYTSVNTSRIRHGLLDNSNCSICPWDSCLFRPQLPFYPSLLENLLHWLQPFHQQLLWPGNQWFWSINSKESLESLLLMFISIKIIQYYIRVGYSMAIMRQSMQPSY